jgi:hypothetical protein
MKLIALYVADKEDARGYRKMLEDQGIEVPIFVVSKEEVPTFGYKLPALMTKYNTYEGEFAVAHALWLIKKIYG